MPNRAIGAVVHALTQGYSRMAARLNDHRLAYLLHNLTPPFDIHREVVFRTPEQIRIAKNAAIKARAILNGRSRVRDNGIALGEDTYIKEGCYFDAYGGYIDIGGCCAFGQNTVIHGGGGVTIGKYVIVGPDVLIISSNHEYRSDEYPIMLQGDVRKGISIGSNVWLGSKVIVLDGVEIGNNCVVAAGTVLRTSVPSNSIVYNAKPLTVREMYP